MDRDLRQGARLPRNARLYPYLGCAPSGRVLRPLRSAHLAYVHGGGRRRSADCAVERSKPGYLPSCDSDGEQHNGTDRCKRWDCCNLHCHPTDGLGSYTSRSGRALRTLEADEVAARLRRLLKFQDYRRGRLQCSAMRRDSQAMGEADEPQWGEVDDGEPRPAARGGLQSQSLVQLIAHRA